MEKTIRIPWDNSPDGSGSICMRRITAFLITCILTVCLLFFSAEAYDMGKVGVYQTVSMGASHTAVIKPDGSLWAWGRNFEGQVGNGGGKDTVNDDGNSYQSAPVKVLDNVVSVSCGWHHTAAIRSDGSLWVWGSNEDGQIGNGGVGNASLNGKPIQTTPVKILDNVAAVSCGERCTAAIKTDGTLWTWGCFQYPIVSTPQKVMDHVAAVSCREANLCSVIKQDGTLWMWGYFGENAEETWKRLTPANPIRIDSDVAGMSCDSEFIAYIKNDGTVWTWGSNSYGEHGDGTITREQISSTKTRPVQVKGLSNAVSINCGKGYTHVAVILADGSLWMWGSNFDGQLGNGLTGNARHEDVNSYRPIQTVPIKIMDQVASVFCGSNNTAVIKSDGTLWTWGDNSWGALGYEGGDRWNVTSGISTGTSGTSSVVNVRWGAQTTPKQVTDFAVKPSSGANVVQPSAPTVAGFNDVRTTDYFAETVQWAVEKGITAGTTRTTFSPGAACTRAQIITFLWRAAGSPEPQSVDNPFDNVKETDYYYKAALWAYETGMESGTFFGASDNCTRASTVQYMWQAAGSPEVTAETDFSDVNSGADYAQAVAWAVEQGVTSGTGRTTFSPNDICTRAQIVTFLHRAFAK